MAGRTTLLPRRRRPATTGGHCYWNGFFDGCLDRWTQWTEWSDDGLLTAKEARSLGPIIWSVPRLQNRAYENDADLIYSRASGSGVDGGAGTTEAAVAVQPKIGFDIYLASLYTIFNPEFLLALRGRPGRYFWRCPGCVAR